jgi:ABC-type branched-subunit amino acid transport system substrate-binding protein
VGWLGLKRSRAVGVLCLVVVAMMSACGSRVTDAQRVASSVPTRAEQAADPASRVAGVDVVPDGVPQSPTSVAAPTVASVAPGRVGSPASAGAVPASPGPVTDNGGATDVGVTATTITLGNVSVLSGPIPGLFAGAVVGTRAAIAYQNSLGGVHGRTFKLDVRDDQFDSGQNRAQTDELIGKAFALVGGFSLYDDGAVPELVKAQMPVVQLALTPALVQSPVSFSVVPSQQGAATGPWELLKSKFPGALGAVGALYGAVPAASDNYKNVRHAAESVGYKFVYDRSYQATETDFTADVVRMKSAGVKLFFTNSDVKTVARIAKAMAAQSFKPDAFVVLAAAYDSSFPTLAGNAAEGIININSTAMYLGEDAAFNPEVRLMNKWLDKVKPGYRPDAFATYSWASTRLFMKALQDAGPQATRASLLAALRKIDHWNSYELFPDAGPASKRPPTCFIMLIVKNGKFERWNSPPPGFNCQGRYVMR